MADQLAPLQQFEYLPGMNLRVLQKDGEPWFVAKDVCEALDLAPYKGGYGHHLAHLDPSEVTPIFKIGVAGTAVQGNARLVSESGLYLLVLRSRKPEAKAFQKWVTGEVLGGPTDRQGRGIPLGKTTHGTSPERHT